MQATSPARVNGNPVHTDNEVDLPIASANVDAAVVSAVIVGLWWMKLASCARPARPPNELSAVPASQLLR
jgi:hypothetical protein